MRLSSEEFKAVLENSSPRYAEKTINALELVFVHGYSQRRACEITGLNTSQLSMRVTNLRKKLHEYTKCPPDWRLVRLCLPPNLEPDLSILLRKIDKEIAIYQGAKTLNKKTAKKTKSPRPKRKTKRS